MSGSVRLSVASLWLGVAMMVGSSAAEAQTVQVFADGLRSPIRLLAVNDPDYLLVAEAGTKEFNAGRVSMFDRHGARCTVIDGLPSAPDHVGAEPSGPSGLLFQGKRLYITIGGGNEVILGPVAGSELPNPAVASPLFSSVLLLEFEADEDAPLCGFTLTLDHQRVMAAGQEVRLRGERGDARMRLIANFPDFTPEPRPDLPTNVRSSNPFGIVGTAGQLEVNDAGRNLIWRVFVPTGQFEVLASFAQVPNTLVPVGPPRVDAVPAGLRWYGDELIVSLLTGFPFGPGAASLRLVNRQDGSNRPFITGLQTAVDVLPTDNEDGPLYVIEMSAALAQRTPGRILRFSGSGSPTVVAEALPTPTGLEQEPWGRDLLVTDYAGGRILRVLTPR